MSLLGMQLKKWPNEWLNGFSGWKSCSQFGTPKNLSGSEEPFKSTEWLSAECADIE